MIVYDRLHYAGATTAVAPFLVAAAAIVEEGTHNPSWNAVFVAVALALALGLLYRSRVLAVAANRVVTALKIVHSGHVGDYVAWLTFGTALVGGVFALTLR